MNNRTKKWMVGAFAVVLLAGAMAFLLGNLSSSKGTGCAMSGNCPSAVAGGNAQGNSNSQGQNVTFAEHCSSGACPASGGCGGNGSGRGMMSGSGRGMMGGSGQGACPMMRGSSL